MAEPAVKRPLAVEEENGTLQTVKTLDSGPDGGDGTTQPPQKAIKVSDSADRPHSSARGTTQTGIGSVVANHYNKIEDKGLTERSKSRIFYMRNFNNWIKSYLLMRHLELIRDQVPDDHHIVAMDLCCGKGGDLFKWQKGNIRHLICVDIAETSVAQCKERFETNKQKNRGQKFSAEFIVADCTKSRIRNLFKKPDMKLDIVSCQFAFHYSFESLNQAETMVRNASENLRKGGYFVATIPNANEIMSRLEVSGSNGFGNEVCRIEFPEERETVGNLFGDKYNFFLEGVVNCPEFLVHFATLTRICKKYGLELQFKKQFSDLYKEAYSHSECRNLLFKMMALESYPPRQGEEAATTSDGEYTHAKSYMETEQQFQVKTLSKSEWEAISLYMAFGFKKVT